MAGSGEILTLIIDKIVAGGDGLGRDERISVDERAKAVFVPMVLPGERVRVRVTEKRGDFDRAELVEVLDASPSRVEPPCRLYGLCGGCNFQHMSYDEQMRQKLLIVSDTFRRIAGITIETLSMVPGKPLHYRNRVQLHRGSNGALGFKSRNGAEIVPVESCPIAHQSINQFLERVRAGAQTIPLLERFTVIGTDAGTDLSGHHDRRSLSILGKSVSYLPDAFFQSNLEMVDELIPWVIDGLDGDTAADLYAGVGVFSMFLTERYGTVHVVEENTAACNCAKSNLSATDAKGTFVVHPRRVEQWLSRDYRGHRLDAVVVDPPRSGLSKVVRSELISRRVPEIRYVSCNPVTLARDAAAFKTAGYRLGSCTLFDFYPNTAHIEALLSFSREGASR